MLKQATALAQGASSPVVKVPRSKLGLTEVMLVAKTGGRCEFRGCNEFLYEHALTGEAGNFAENAHIVAFREGGPRGRGARPAVIDSIDNLMLLCRRDHKLIDDNPERYPREELQAHKREHEARIRRVTGLGPSMQTTVLAFTAMIGTFKPAIGRVEMSEALLPRYPGDTFHILDLTSLGSEEPGALYEVACRRIVQQAEALHAAGGPLEATRHLSVFRPRARSRCSSCWGMRSATKWRQTSTSAIEINLSGGPGTRARRLPASPCESSSAVPTPPGLHLSCL